MYKTYLVGAVMSVLAIPVSSRGAVADPQVTPDVAEAGLAEIVVTAQKRSENLQNVPISISVVNASTLESAHITNVGDLPILVPDLQVAQNTGVFNIFMRGIGNPATTVGDEASVAVYVDGVYYPRLPPAMFELNNIDSVELLKGPQGTLFGRNATGGLINIVTKDPGATPTLHVDVGYGNYQTLTDNLYASTGIGDKLAVDIALHETHMGAGWGTDLLNGSSFGWLDSKVARNKWVYTPLDGTKLTLTLDYSASQSTQEVLASLQARGYTHGPYCGIPSCTPLTPPNNVAYPNLGFYNENDDALPIVKDTSKGGALKVEQDLPFAKLVSISAAHYQTGVLYIDADASPEPYFTFEAPYVVQSISQELQLISKPASPFDWTVGLYYTNIRSKYDPIRFTGAEWENAFALPNGQFDLYGSQTVNSYAGYTQETFHLSSDTNLTAGLRYTMDKVSATGHNDIADPILGVDINTGTQSESQDFDKLTYRLALDHHFTDALMAYVSYNRGFKGGTYNLLPFSQIPGPANPAVNPEVVDAFELGAKTDLIEHRLRLSTALFYNKITNLQVSTIRPVGDPPTEEVFNTNAAKARSKGIDLELEALLTEEFVVHFSTTIMDPIYTSFPNAGRSVPAADGIGTVLGPFDASGLQLPYAPKVAFNLGGNYKIPTSFGTWVLATDYTFTSGYPLAQDQIVNNGNVGLLGARVSYQPPSKADHWKILVWGKNLTDKQYYDASNAENNRSGEIVTPAAPRTFGVTFSYDW